MHAIYSGVFQGSHRSDIVLGQHRCHWSNSEEGLTRSLLWRAWDRRLEQKQRHSGPARCGLRIGSQRDDDTQNLLCYTQARLVRRALRSLLLDDGIFRDSIRWMNHFVLRWLKIVGARSVRGSCQLSVLLLILSLLSRRLSEWKWWKWGRC